MSKRNWLSEHSFGVVVTALSLASLLAFSVAGWTLGRQYQYRTQTAEQNAAAYSGQGDEHAKDRCSLIAGLSDAIDCLVQKIAATRETQRSEQDLAAQQSMADWALWIVWISGIQAAFSLGGVFLLVRNLALVRESNDNAIRAVEAAERGNEISRDAAIAQTRPWIQILELGVEKYEVKKELLHLNIEVKVKNSGNSPAHKVELYGAIRIEEFGKIPWAVIKEFCDEIRTREYPSDHTLFPEETELISQGIGLGMEATAKAREDDLKRRRMAFQNHPKAKDLIARLEAHPWPVGLFLLGSVRYRTHGSPVVHQTAFIYSILARGDKPNQYKSAPLEVGNWDADQIELVNAGVGVFAD